MFFGILTLFTALSMATVAAVFAIYGIVAIFAGMPQFALVMGAVIELGKIVGVSWLYRNWTEPTKIKYFMTPLVLVAMLLTSMGIFGLLSKAHLEQTAPVATSQVQIERLERQIQQENSRITDSEAVINQLDQSVQVLINFDRIRGPDGALAVRESQAEQRELLRQVIEESTKEVNRLEDQRLELVQSVRAIELEVGPLKYIAELIYGDGQDRTEEAVRWVIIAFIFVFDPMAILLLMAANYTFDRRKREILTSNTKIEITEDQDNDDYDKEEIIDDDKSSEGNDTNDQSELQSEPEPESNNIDQTNFDIQNSIDGEGGRDILPLQQEGTISDNESTSVESIDIDKKNSSIIDKHIITENVTPIHDIGNGYVEYNNHMYKREALKELQPELFNNYTSSSGFGTSFPPIAKKSDTFVRVDVLPNRVYKYDGNHWNEVSKDITETYLYDQEYIKFIISKIESGEYDIDLLTEHERIQIEEYLQQVVKN